eukprot:3432407-Rhodomonas_salina.1
MPVVRHIHSGPELGSSAQLQSCCTIVLVPLLRLVSGSQSCDRAFTAALASTLLAAVGMLSPGTIACAYRLRLDNSYRLRKSSTPRY